LELDELGVDKIHPPHDKRGAYTERQLSIQSFIQTAQLGVQRNAMRRRPAPSHRGQV
jgi:hypothetical protein